MHRGDGFASASPFQENRDLRSFRERRGGGVFSDETPARGPLEQAERRPRLVEHGRYRYEKRLLELILSRHGRVADLIGEGHPG